MFYEHKPLQYFFRSPKNLPVPNPCLFLCTQPIYQWHHEVIMIVKDFSLCAACLVCKVTQNHKNLLYEIKYCGRPFKLNVYLRHHSHGVWKSQKKSHSTLRAKRATFTFWVDKRLIWPIWRVFENLKLAVKQCYQTGQF